MRLLKTKQTQEFNGLATACCLLLLRVFYLPARKQKYTPTNMNVVESNHTRTCVCSSGDSTPRGKGIVARVRDLTTGEVAHLATKNMAFVTASL